MHKSIRNIRLIGGFIITISLLLFARTVFSASLSQISDTLSTIKVSTAANQTVGFTLDSGNTFAAGETMTITYPSSSFDLTGLVASDFDVTTDGVDRNLVSNGACASSDAIELTSVSATIITLTACPSFTASAAGASIVIEIGTNATYGGSGSHQITNPSSANAYILLFAAGGDTGYAAVAILSDDQVQVSGSVDPTLSVSISSATCDLGTLVNSQINTCQYNVVVSTNAQNGYVATVRDDGDLRQTAGPTITDAGGDNDIDQGSEEYGVGTSKAGQTIVQYTTCNNPASNPQPASALLITPQQFASAGVAVNSDSTTLCHAASVTGATEAGTYSQMVTLVVTANY